MDVVSHLEPGFAIPAVKGLPAAAVHSSRRCELTAAAAAHDSDAGSSLTQAVVFTALLLVVIKGLGSIGILNVTPIDNFSRLAVRATGHVQDRLEQFMGLAPGSDTAVALVLSLLVVLLVSAIGATMFVLARSRRSPSARDRLILQARKGAESGANRAARFLLDSYVLPGTGHDPLAQYDSTGSPVLYQGHPVVLSALSGPTPNYPLESVQTAFAAAAQGTMTSGGALVSYAASATLLSMRSVTPFGAAAPIVVQSWRVTARGTLLGSRQARVEVSTMIERQLDATFTYGLFAAQDTCRGLQFSGGVRVRSYDSSNVTLVAGLPQSDGWGGHVGTNGNLSEDGGSIIHGSLSTLRRGVGNCLEGPVNPASFSGPNHISGGLVTLSQPVVPAPPAQPFPLPPTISLVISTTSSCDDLPDKSRACRAPDPLTGEDVITLDPQGAPMLLGNLEVAAGCVVVLHAGTYHINSIRLTGNSILRIGSGPVILNVAGADQGTPVDLEGGAVTDPSFVPSNLRILYAGTGVLKLTGGATLAVSVYAPLAEARIAGGAQVFGAIVASRIVVSGGGTFHYDRRLQQYFSVGPPVMSIPTWKVC